jgi:hypothetical protein
MSSQSVCDFEFFPRLTRVGVRSQVVGLINARIGRATAHGLSITGSARTSMFMIVSYRKEIKAAET